MKSKLVFFICMFFLNVACAQKASINLDEHNFQLYLLIGQSNMAGRGEITFEYNNISHPRVLMLNKELKWVVAKHPVHFDKPTVAGVGPGLSFAIKMAEQNPNITIGLIPCAVGGTSLNLWKEGVQDPVTKLYPYDDAIKRINAVKNDGVFKGIIFHQGEADVKYPELWLQNFKMLITSFRAQTVDKLPVVVGELGYFYSPSKSINDVMKQLPKEMENIAVATAENLSDKGDKVHFDAQSAHILGKRFAEKMILLQRKK